MLVQALTDRFNGYFTQKAYHDTVLWFDPDGEYAGLLDHLTGVTLWHYEGSLLRIRYRLNQRTPGERVVVYLPMNEEKADLLRPFLATSLCLKDRLYRFLRHQGLAFPDDARAAHLMRELLPQLAIRSVGKGRQFWEYNLANLERAINTLLGEFDGTLLRFLERPAEELARLCADQFDGLFFAQLAGAYGLEATPDDDPRQVARDLTAQLVLARAFTHASHSADTEAGQPDDFPYSRRLPQPHQFDRCARFLDRWQNDARYAPTYARLAAEVGQVYSLGNWLEALPIEQALSLGPTLPDAEAALWERVLRTLTKLESEAEWREWLAAQRTALQGRAEGFWVRQGQDPGWNVLVQAADLLNLSHEMRGELPKISQPGAMQHRYASHWWQIDAAHRTFREALADAPGGLDPVRDRCARAYGDALRAVNERFSTLLEAEGHWPPKGALPAQNRFWAEEVGALDKSQRMAVLFVDALRYELAQALLAQLEADRAGDSRLLNARLAAIPTVTQLGMAALLPDGHQRRVTHDGEWHVQIRDSGDLAGKAARIEWLTSCLPGCTTAIHNLNDLLRTPVDQIERADCTFVFDTTLDAVGENASELAWDTFEPLVRSVKQGVHKLLELGVETIHVVTDHGFLLLHEVAEHDKVSVRHVDATARKSRYLVGTHLGSTDQLEFEVPCSEGPSGASGQALEAWFPCGVGCFRTPGRYNYVHGGLSLQELVVPQLTIRQRQLGRPVGVRIELPAVIRQGQMKFTLEPIAETLVDQPRRVRLSLEKEGTPVVPPFEATVLPTDSATLDVWLPGGCGLEMGDRVEWVLRDLLTGEVLKRQDAISQVDLW